MVKTEQVAVRILEERLVADARVDDVSLELDAACLELRAGGLDVGTRSAIGWLFDLNAMPKASDCITAIVSVPVSNSAAGIWPQRLESGSPSTLP